MMYVVAGQPKRWRGHQRCANYTMLAALQAPNAPLQIAGVHAVNRACFAGCLLTVHHVIHNSAKIRRH